MTKDAALNLALEFAKTIYKEQGWGSAFKIIQACKEALEQPAQKPLSDEILLKLEWEHQRSDYYGMARAVERLHGIGDNHEL